jgi:hypothetical protein
MAPPADPLSELQEWYAAQCNDEWEHAYGVTIDTLDNPGWRLRIDIRDTSLAERSHERQEIHRNEEDWLVCWVEEEQFNAACGPRNLVEAIALFLEWARVA